MNRKKLLEHIRKIVYKQAQLAQTGADGTGSVEVNRDWLVELSKELGVLARDLSTLLETDSKGSEEVDTSRLTMLMDDEADG